MKTIYKNLLQRKMINMKNIYEKQVLLNAVGTVIRNENGEIVLAVQEKDDYKEIPFEQILDELLESEVIIKATLR